MNTLQSQYQLPHYYLITGNYPDDENEFLNCLQHALQNGIRLVQLRAKQFSRNKYESLAIQAIKLCHEYQAKLLINTDIEMAHQLNADGVHLPSKYLLTLKERPSASISLVAASCHNKYELHYAKNIGIDFVTLSPVLPTSSHPQALALGWDQFAKLCLLTSLPTYALGGMTQKHLAKAQQHGAYGIAAIRAFWSD